MPANAGRYASGVTPAPMGTLTALSPSPLDENLLWAGTDDGNIQVMTGAARTWTNVTPAAVKPWTRIFNIEAGHFNKLTAYAAANTFRLDDLNPHLFRTHDGGKTWTEINAESRRARPPIPFARIRGSGVSSTRPRIRRCGCPSTTATTGSRCASTCRPSRCATYGEGRPDLLVRGPGGRDPRARVLDPRRPDPASRGRRHPRGAGRPYPYLVKPMTAVRVRFGMKTPRHGRRNCPRVRIRRRVRSSTTSCRPIRRP